MGVGTLDVTAAASLPPRLAQLELCGYAEASGLDRLPDSLTVLRWSTLGTALDLRPSLPPGLKVSVLRLPCQQRLTVDWEQLCALPACVELEARTLHERLPATGAASSQLAQLAAMLASGALRSLCMLLCRAELLSYQSSPDGDGTRVERLPCLRR